MKELIGAAFIFAFAGFYLTQFDRGYVDFGPITNKFMGAVYMVFGGWGAIEAVRDVITKGSTLEAALRGAAGILYIALGYGLYGKGGPPRKKRRRVRNAIKRLTSGRLVPVPTS